MSPIHGDAYVAWEHESAHTDTHAHDFHHCELLSDSVGACFNAYVFPRSSYKIQPISGLSTYMSGRISQVHSITN